MTNQTPTESDILASALRRELAAALHQLRKAIEAESFACPSGQSPRVTGLLGLMGSLPEELEPLAARVDREAIPRVLEHVRNERDRATQAFAEAQRRFDERMARLHDVAAKYDAVARMLEQHEGAPEIRWQPNGRE